MSVNLTCGKGLTKLQNLINLRSSSFAESHQMQHNNFEVSPNIRSLVGVERGVCVDGGGGDLSLTQPLRLLTTGTPSLTTSSQTLSKAGRGGGDGTSGGPAEGHTEHILQGESTVYKGQPLKPIPIRVENIMEICLEIKCL